MRYLLLLVVVGAWAGACSSSATPPPATAAGSGGGSTSGSAATTGQGGSAAMCKAAVDGVIAGGCTRCWPAYDVLCSKGNPAAVAGLLDCLVLTDGGNVCWDIGDPNSAVPCMQSVVDANSDANIVAIEMKITGLNCGAEAPTMAAAYAVMLSDADRASFASCISTATSCMGSTLTSCLSKTALDTTLCNN